MGRRYSEIENRKVGLYMSVELKDRVMGLLADEGGGISFNKLVSKLLVDWCEGIERGRDEARRVREGLEGDGW